MTESLLLWGIGLLVVSLLLIVVEAFVPSAGVISLVAAVVGIAGLVCLFRVDWVWGLCGTLAMVLLVPVMAYLALQIMPTTTFGKRLLYGSDIPDPEAADAPIGDGLFGDELQLLVGLEGEALTDMRPVGTVRVIIPDDESGDPSSDPSMPSPTIAQRFEAASETSLIRKGERIRVTAVIGNRLKVRPLRTGSGPPPRQA